MSAPKHDYDYLKYCANCWYNRQAGQWQTKDRMMSGSPLLTINLGRNTTEAFETLIRLEMI